MTWSDVGWNVSPASPSGFPHAMALDPFEAGHLLLGWNSGPWAAGTGQLYSSSDHGASWQEVTLPNAVTSINSIAFDPGTSGLVYLTTNATGVYRSTRRRRALDAGGSTREQPDMQYAEQHRHRHAAPAHRVRSGPRRQPSFRSLDGGKTWERLQSSPSGGSDFMFAGADSTRLYGATGTGLFLSTDIGDTWNRAVGALGPPPGHGAGLGRRGRPHDHLRSHDRGRRRRGQSARPPGRPGLRSARRARWWTPASTAMSCCRCPS